MPEDKFAACVDVRSPRNYMSRPCGSLTKTIKDNYNKLFPAL